MPHKPTGDGVAFVPICRTMPRRTDNVTLLVKHILSKWGNGALFHVTDEGNFPLIAKYGLLSKQQIEIKGVVPVYPGGNDLTWALDRDYGLWNYVFLAFHTSIVMPKQPDARRRRPRFLRIDPRVLHLPGVRIALGCANHRGTKTYYVSRAVEWMDREAFVGQLDWNDVVMRGRMRRALKYEVLVPTVVPPEYIVGVVDA